jgi:signal transduction histidine kinase
VLFQQLLLSHKHFSLLVKLRPQLFSVVIGIDPRRLSALLLFVSSIFILQSQQFILQSAYLSIRLVQSTRHLFQLLLRKVACIHFALIGNAQILFGFIAVAQLFLKLARQINLISRMVGKRVLPRLHSSIVRVSFCRCHRLVIFHN